MKKRNLKLLKLQKTSISVLNQNKGGVGGDTTSNTGNHLTADVKDCPDNTLAIGCNSLGYCPHSWGSRVDCGCVA